MLAEQLDFPIYSTPADGVHRRRALVRRGARRPGRRGGRLGTGSARASPSRGRSAAARRTRRGSGATRCWCSTDGPAIAGEWAAWRRTWRAGIISTLREIDPDSPLLHGDDSRDDRHAGRAMNKGDAVAAETVRRTARYLGVAVGSLINVSIGQALTGAQQLGGGARLRDALLSGMREAVAEHALPRPLEGARSCSARSRTTRSASAPRLSRSKARWGARRSRGRRTTAAAPAANARRPALARAFNSCMNLARAIERSRRQWRRGPRGTTRGRAPWTGTRQDSGTPGRPHPGRRAAVRDREQRADPPAGTGQQIGPVERRAGGLRPHLPAGRIPALPRGRARSRRHRRAVRGRARRGHGP